MDFNRKHDYSDQYAFLPDNRTIGTKEYFKRKYGDKFPDYIYEIMEAEHRVEYTKEDKSNLIRAIARLQQEQNEKLMSEFIERSTPQSEDEVGLKVFAPCILDDQPNQLSNNVLQSDISQ